MRRPGGRSRVPWGEDRLLKGNLGVDQQDLRELGKSRSAVAAGIQIPPNIALDTHFPSAL